MDLILVQAQPMKSSCSVKPFVPFNQAFDRRKLGFVSNNMFACFKLKLVSPHNFWIGLKTTKLIFLLLIFGLGYICKLIFPSNLVLNNQMIGFKCLMKFSEGWIDRE